jgi:hypothetical protein
LSDTNGVSNIEASGFCAPQRLQVCPAAETLADVVDISANIETLAAQNTKIDLGKDYSINCVAIDMHQARFPLDHFP